MGRILLFIISLILLQACGSYSVRQEFYRGEIRYQLDAGNTLYKQGKLEDAIAAYRKAIHMAPNDAEAHASLGNAYLAKGDMQHAEKQYRRAITLKPELKKTLESSLAYALSSPAEGDHATVTGLLEALKVADTGNMQALKAYASAIRDLPAWSLNRHRVLNASTRSISQRFLKLYHSGAFASCPDCLKIAASWCAEENNPEHFPLIMKAIQDTADKTLAATLAYKLGLAYEKNGQHARAMDVYLMFPDDPDIAKRLAR